MSKRSATPFFNTTPDITTVFPYNKQEVAETLAEQKVNGWTKEQALEAINNELKQPVTGDLWLYYGIHHAFVTIKKLGLRDHYYKDPFSFASLVKSFYTGWLGGFGTDTYEKEEKIEGKCWFLLNRMTENKVSEPTKAKILLLLLEDFYFHTS